MERLIAVGLHLAMIVVGATIAYQISVGVTGAYLADALNVITHIAEETAR